MSELIPTWFRDVHPVTQALLGTLFTWGMTAAGAAVVFVLATSGRRILDIMLGFAAGVMLAASYWSLLAPALEMAEGGALPPYVPVAIGFLMGGVFLRIADRLIPHLHLGAPMEEVEGVRTSWQRTTLLVLAITLHNIPEGLAVGVAFGAAAHGLPAASLGGAIVLALGIGIQNLPEGMAVSMPLRREGISPLRCFWYGQVSGMVEPIAGVLGAASVLYWVPILPYALAFAAGAMVFVVVEEVIPEAQRGGFGDESTMGAMVGFTLMMVLDVALG